MANRGYSGSNVMLVRNESSNDMSLVAMLASCTPVALQVPRAGGGGLDDAVASSSQKRFFSPTLEASTGEDQGEEDTGDDCTQHVEKKRRLSNDQVRSLEKSFEIENKLEPERKMQLARDLGLMPRQVAVWFQNRRARWKTKQLERDYDVLTADYNSLKTHYDVVLTEKKKLQMKIESLTGKLKVTAPDVVVAPPERNKESKLPSEESVKPKLPPKLPIASNEVRKEEGSSLETISSNSISSEVLNVDSPHTMDSAAPPLVIPMNLYPELSPDMDSHAILHFPSDNLLLDPLDCKLISVKPEEGSYQDESCGYMLTQMDDEKQPWWEWNSLDIHSTLHTL